MAVSEFLMGKPGETVKLQTQSPEQEQLQKRLIGLLMPQLGGLTAGQSGFGPIADQARLGFRQKTVPSIMERFGATSSLEDSGLPQMLGSAGTDLESSLAALNAQFGQQQQGNLMNLLAMAMRPQFEPMYQPRQPGVFESAGPSVLRSLLKLLI